MANVLLILSVVLVIVGAVQASQKRLQRGLALVGAGFGSFVGVMWKGFNPHLGLIEYLVILLPLAVAGWLVGWFGGEAVERGRRRGQNT